MATALHAILPSESVGMEPQHIVSLARTAEDLGYDMVWLPDHLLPPRPYGTTYGGVYEPLITMTAIAAATSRIRFGTSVLVLPLRDPFLLAKQASTLERLAPGRLTLGVGTGWDAVEFAAVGADFANRGARADEALRLIRHLHEHGRGPFNGQHYGFGAGEFAPLPSSPVPIMVGGTSGAALRRAARYADVWQGVGLDEAGFRERVGDLRRRAERPIEVGTRTSMDAGTTAAAAVAEASGLAEAGADHVAVWFGSFDGYSDRMAEFAHLWRQAHD
ncbi:TIGR03619 family F420-dependent LLM class oxidoreductase [Phytoactinopolyspora mesophila]|uniref:TIGR03619 family F420-dependent LLM class oxidoreductase n=1 Tax=Phytoactinopolyspora mesophila TaxID=2650750 RepID=A0A7K3M2D3_9ACTN|nr:TIGR03619 family F420-dependent LLM class oxidoreductase [Phytoactinopolyspora mesophila]NDL57451.1 TIGR03619 family F420-dependent LLM class oxidoreductase [Phytoactinopolyspora mesophila]